MSFPDAAMLTNRSEAAKKNMPFFGGIGATFPMLAIFAMMGNSAEGLYPRLALYPDGDIYPKVESGRE